MLGDRFYQPTVEAWSEYEPVIGEHISDRDHDLLVIHERDVCAL
jgi:hypothetical protein